MRRPYAFAGLWTCDTGWGTASGPLLESPRFRAGGTAAFARGRFFRSGAPRHLSSYGSFRETSVRMRRVRLPGRALGRSLPAVQGMERSEGVGTARAEGEDVGGVPIQSGSGRSGGRGACLGTRVQFRAAGFRHP